MTIRDNAKILPPKAEPKGVQQEVTPIPKTPLEECAHNQQLQFDGEFLLNFRSSYMLVRHYICKTCRHHITKRHKLYVSEDFELIVTDMGYHA